MVQTASHGLLLYDGHCPFCRGQAERIQRWSGRRVGITSFHEPGVLDRFPKLTHEECMKEIKLTEPDGRITGGMEAVVRTVRLNPVIRLIAWIYFIPGIRHAADGSYRWVAANRYRFGGKMDCPDGTCSRHIP